MKDFVSELSEKEREQCLKRLWPKLEPIVNGTKDHDGLKQILAAVVHSGDVHGVILITEVISGMLEASWELAGIRPVYDGEEITREEVAGSC